MNITAKLSLLIASAMMAILGIVGYMAAQDINRQVQEEFGMILQQIARMTAYELDGDAHRELGAWIRQGRDAYQHPTFWQMRERLEKAIHDTDIPHSGIYTLIPDPQHPYSTIFGVSLHDRGNAIAGKHYVLLPQNRPAYDTARLQRRSSYTRLYRDTDGTWISAYAPIVDQRGETAAILEVDFDTTAYHERLYASLYDRLQILLVLLLTSLIGAYVAAWRFSSRIIRIEQGVRRIAQGDNRFDVRIEGNDELCRLCESVRQMSVWLAERLEMLKFLPPHTQALIQSARVAGLSLDGVNKEMVVVFTDVRGFTAIAEKQPPEAVLAALNRLFVIQARHYCPVGGTIDKFLGDALLILLEGEQALSRAVAASLALQQELMKQHPDENGILFQIGIGIHRGRLVQGAMGVPQRMDYTVIGGTVNIATRLSQLARAGETVMLADTAEEWETERQLTTLGRSTAPDGKRSESTEEPPLQIESEYVMIRGIAGKKHIVRLRNPTPMAAVEPAKPEALHPLPA